TRQRFETEDLARSGCACQRNPGQSDRAGAEHGDRAAWLESAGAGEHPLVCDAHRFAHRADLQCELVGSVAVADGVERPTVLRVASDVFGKPAVDGEAEILDLFALVPVAATTGRAAAAPLDLLGGDEVSLAEPADLGTDSDDRPGNLMAGNNRAAHVVGQEHVALLVGLEHMNV